MKRLNNKGYLIIEIILASAIAFSIAYYLINLTYKFKDKNEDIYASANLASDKISITTSIMNEMDDYYIKDIEKKEDGGQYSYEFSLQSKKTLTEEKRELIVNLNENQIQYINATATSGEQVVFEKTLDKGYRLGKPDYNIFDPLIQISLPIHATYEKKDTYIRLLLEKSEGTYTPGGENLFSFLSLVELEHNPDLEFTLEENKITIKNPTNEIISATISGKITLSNTQNYCFAFEDGDENMHIYLDSEGGTTQFTLQNHQVFTPDINAKYYVKVEIPANQTYEISNITLTQGTITNLQSQ